MRFLFLRAIREKSMNKARRDNASIDGRLAQKCFANKIHLIKPANN